MNIKKIIAFLFSSKKQREINRVLKENSVNRENDPYKDAKCVCDMPGVSGYCHTHRTSWL